MKEKPEHEPCAMCNRRVPTSLEPSRSMLVFGPFKNMHYVMERRCAKCERKLAASITKMLSALILLAIPFAGCASRGEVRATADYTQAQGPRAAVELAAKW